MDRLEQDNPMDPQQVDPQLCQLLDQALAPAPQGSDDAMPADLIDRVLGLTIHADLLDEALAPASLSQPMSADLVDRILALTDKSQLLDQALAADTVAHEASDDLVDRIMNLTADSQALDAALSADAVPGGVPADLINRIANLTRHSQLLNAALGPEALPDGVPAELIERIAALTQTPVYDVELFNDALAAEAIDGGVPVGMVDRISALTQDATLLDQALSAESTAAQTQARLISQIEDLTADAKLLDEALAPTGAFEAPADMLDRIADASAHVLAEHAAIEQVVDLSREDDELGQPLPFPTGGKLPETAGSAGAAPVAQSIFDTHDVFDENATRSLTALLPHLDRRARKDDGRKGLSAMLGPKRTRIARQIAAAVILAAEAGIWFTLVTIADDARAIVAIDQELEELADTEAQLEPMMMDELDSEIEQLRQDMLNDSLSNWGTEDPAPTLDEALRANDFSFSQEPEDEFGDRP